MREGTLSLQELLDAWPALSDEDRVGGFALLPRDQAEKLFLGLSSREQADLLLALPTGERRMWMRLLAPDDAADVIQQAPEQRREALLSVLDEAGRREVAALLAYAEDQAGGVMNPRYARLRPDMSVDEAISYLRRLSREQIENIYYGYVLDVDQRLLGVVSLRELVTAAPGKRVRDVMRTDLVTIPEEMDQEAVSHVFARHNLLALPVVDAQGRMKGIVTADDIVDVVNEEATEDIQKIGGSEALDAPYLQVDLAQMLRKRVGWLTALLLAEMLAVVTLRGFQERIEQVVALALFVPLIVSSGGNSGSQAATLIVRAMALGQVRLRDWWRVIRRELATGLMLGLALGAISTALVGFWHLAASQTGRAGFGPAGPRIGLTVGLSVLSVALWGTLTGSMLPFILRRGGLDPASACAPLIATLVDVSGIVIYFTVASLILEGMPR